MKPWWQQRPAGSPVLWRILFHSLRILPWRFLIISSIFAAYFVFPFAPRLILSFRRGLPIVRRNRHQRTVNIRSSRGERRDAEKQPNIHGFLSELLPFLRVSALSARCMSFPSENPKKLEVSVTRPTAGHQKSLKSPLPGTVLWHIAAFLRMALGGPHIVRQRILIRRSSFPILSQQLQNGGLVLVSHLGHTQSLAWILAKQTKKPCHLVAARIESPEQNTAFRSSMPEPKPTEIDAWKPDAAWKILQALRSGDLVFLPADRVLPGTRIQKCIFLCNPKYFPASPTWFHQQIPKSILAAALIEVRPGIFLLEVQQLEDPKDFVPWLETMTLTWPQQSFDLSNPRDLEFG